MVVNIDEHKSPARHNNSPGRGFGGRRVKNVNKMAWQWIHPSIRTQSADGGSSLLPTSINASSSIPSHHPTATAMQRAGKREEGGANRARPLYDPLFVQNNTAAKRATRLADLQGDPPGRTEEGEKEGKNSVPLIIYSFFFFFFSSSFQRKLGISPPSFFIDMPWFLSSLSLCLVFSFPPTGDREREGESGSGGKERRNAH